MFAPANFSVEPVAAAEASNPKPPKITKSQIYFDIKVFKAVDDYAIKISKKNYGTFRDLIWNLCYKKKFTELEKARAIFRWMTARDLHTISFEDANPGSPEQLLLSFQAGKTTYARIFECLARHAGLACITLSGWAKGVDYRPGVALTARPINHSWNAVRIDADWQLVDCHWATRFLQSERNVPENLVYEYDDFYFIPDPAELGYTHRPEESAWQLLPATNVISAAKFEDYPLVKSYFFTTGMLFLPKNNQGVIKTKKGISALSIGFTGRTAFTFKLGYGAEMKETLNGRDLNRCVIQETRDDRVVFYVRLLDRGDFYLIVFANVVNDQVSSSENIFKAVCEYKIECEDPAPESVGLFPGCSDASWGPDTFVNQFGLTPMNKAAILLAPDGHAEVSFERKGDVRVYARLIKDGVEDATLKQAVSVKNDGDKTTVVVNLPAEGEYGLEVFANEPKKDGDMFTHVCQYLCAYTNKDADQAYGHVPTEAPLKPAVTRPLHAADRATAVENPELLYKGFVDTEEADDNVDSAEYVKKYPFGRSAASQKKRLSLQQSVDPEEEYQPHAAAVYRADIDVAPPESFQMKAIKEEMAPVPEAPSTATKLFIDTSVFHNVDTHAMEVSKLEHASFRDILWHLIYARDITNELDKARAIFLWLCSKDLSKLNFSNVEKGSPEEILMNLQRGQTTYARVYETLCSYAGLLCKTLTGYAKGAEYKPGMKFAGTQGQHSWNAVKVNGTWQLVDCHWAARRVVGKKLEKAASKLEITSDNVRYELDEYYFMPAPTQLIFTHFPEDPSWQLLEDIITVDDFQNLVPVKPAFFKYGLELDSHTDATIYTPGEDITIQIKCPPKMAKSLRFTFNLTYEDGREQYQNIKLNRFAMQELVAAVAYLTVRLPEKGAYQMVIYAKDLDQQTKEGVYGGVCEYKLICKNDPPKAVPFPPCVHTTWGPGDSAPKFDMKPRQSGSIVTTTNGIAEVKFGINSRLRFVAKLKSNEKDDKALAPYIVYRTIDDEVVFRVAAPYQGEFGLEIYANNPALGGQALQHAYQYLVICAESVAPDSVQPFPTLTSSYLGAQPSFDVFGLSTESHPDPYVEANLRVSGPIKISLRMSRALRITSQLLYVADGKAVDSSEYILQQSANKGVTFVLNLNKTGWFKFQIFATLQSETGDSLPGVFNYLINCKSTTMDSPAHYPKQFGPWKEGCSLETPLEGALQSSQEAIFFKMDVPRASAVAVVIGQEWTQLKQSGTSWQGEVPIAKHAGAQHKVTVCGNFGATATSFSTLLEYSM
jgi:hypothetical protein